MEQGREQCGNKEAVKGIFCICFHFNLWFVSKCKEKNLKKTVQRFRWGDEKLETLIKCLARGLYFESDLVKLYSDVQVKMAVWQKWLWTSRGNIYERRHDNWGYSQTQVNSFRGKETDWARLSLHQKKD